MKELGIEENNKGVYYNGKWSGNGPVYTSVNPHNNEPIAHVTHATKEDYEACIKSMDSEMERWVTTPAPVRGEIIRQIGEALREKKGALGSLLSLEMGKIKTEGEGEV